MLDYITKTLPTEKETPTQGVEDLFIKLLCLSRPSPRGHKVFVFLFQIVMETRGVIRQYVQDFTLYSRVRPNAETLDIVNCGAK